MEILKPHRARIDVLDDKIIDLLAERFAIVKAVGQLKAEHGIDVVQSQRVSEVMQRIEAQAKAKGLDTQLAKDIYKLIIDHAHVAENEIKKG